MKFIIFSYLLLISYSVQSMESSPSNLSASQAQLVAALNHLHHNKPAVKKSRNHKYYHCSFEDFIDNNEDILSATMKKIIIALQLYENGNKIYYYMSHNTGQYQKEEVYIFDSEKTLQIHNHEKTQLKAVPSSDFSSLNQLYWIIHEGKKIGKKFTIVSEL